MRGPERVERRDGVGAGEGIKGEMPEPVVERHHRLVAGWRKEADGQRLTAVAELGEFLHCLGCFRCWIGMCMHMLAIRSISIVTDGVPKKDELAIRDRCFLSLIETSLEREMRRCS